MVFAPEINNSEAVSNNRLVALINSFEESIIIITKYRHKFKASGSISLYFKVIIFKSYDIKSGDKLSFENRFNNCI